MRKGPRLRVLWKRCIETTDNAKVFCVDPYARHVYNPGNYSRCAYLFHCGLVILIEAKNLYWEDLSQLVPD